ncbi:Major facilitator superfamily domain, general substrate transporter [Penicillium griseofulvum]|uniref:Major facilitator superfamily domain, general substrate transporter n=1 Tax=Penicillium patulum TaxID=5078 RepID=A0A135LVB7_PENPA|nr:Major facilitator superfamily domain, general substrate transporter [Penicillium griseofulvum]KXG52879.1 Major facilitator superfamily domain, general substrate transporter [Penicillium griseofulvum]
MKVADELGGTEANKEMIEPTTEPQKENILSDWVNDPENAKNWSTKKKLYNTAVPAVSHSSFGLAIYSPSHESVKHSFQTSTVLSLLPFTLYVYGLAFGPAVSAPLSETFGRRFIYVFVTPIALLFILGASFANNLAALAICRLLAGITISAPLAVGAGTIMDMWTGVNTNRGVVLIMTIAFLGPALGELVGGWVAQYKNWQWSQWTTLFLGAAFWIFSTGAQETYAAPLMRRKAKKLGLPLPPSPVPAGLAGARFLVTVTLARPLYMLVPAIPLIFSTTYSFTPGESGLVLIGIAVGCILGGIVLVLLDSHTMRRHVIKHKAALPPPERMLWGAMIGGPLMAGALFWFAWTARPGIHWISSIVATGLFGFSNILVFVSTMLYLTNVYGAKYGASALAANGLLRYVVGGSFPLFTIPMYNNLGYPWASSLLGFIAIAFAFLPWIFYVFGSKVRQSSAYIQ